MRVFPIHAPFPGEHLVDVEPEMALQVTAGWQRRMNLYTGRALSDVALSNEQDERGGRLATLGQMLSPGVVFGLDAALEAPTDANGRQFWLHVAPGMGLCASGEDVSLPTPLRVALPELEPFADGIGILVMQPADVVLSAAPDSEDPCDR